MVDRFHLQPIFHLSKAPRLLLRGAPAVPPEETRPGPRQRQQLSRCDVMQLHGRVYLPDVVPDSAAHERN